MIPRLLGGGSSDSRAAVKKLDIILDSPFVVFYGRPSQASPAELTGSIRLETSEDIDIRKVTVQVEGIQKVSWVAPNAVTPQPMVSKRTIHAESSTPFPPEESMSSTAHRMKAGTHTWPFRFSLPQTLPESVEGLPGSYVVYNINASVERGWGSRALMSSKRFRIVRTLGIDSLDSLNLEQINEDVWFNKLSYRVTVPKVNYIFGSDITADFILTPIKKGLVIGKIKLELIETAVVSYPLGERTLRQKQDQIVCQVEGDLPEDCEVYVTDIHPESPCDESYHFKVNLPLPRSLQKCRQSVDTESIRIDHRLKIYVSLHNPEGHTSQLLVKNVVNLYISPNFPVGEDQCVVARGDQAVVHSEEASSIAAPPTYNQHQLDLLYSDVDQSGLVTPGRFASTLNTPLDHRSRNPSHDNLLSLTAVAPTAETDEADTEASADLLHSRLANLESRRSSIAPSQPQDRSGPGTPYRRSSDESPSATAPSSSHQSSAPPSRTQSGYFATAAHTLQDLTSTSLPPIRQGVPMIDADGEFDMRALTRTPSYNTAVLTPLSHPASTMGLPSYEAATSRNVTPENSPPSTNSALLTINAATATLTLQEPPSAYVRAGRAGRSNSTATAGSDECEAEGEGLTIPTASVVRERSRSRSRSRHLSRASVSTIDTSIFGVGNSSDTDARAGATERRKSTNDPLTPQAVHWPTT